MNNNNNTSRRVLLVVATILAITSTTTNAFSSTHQSIRTTPLFSSSPRHFSISTSRRSNNLNNSNRINHPLQQHDSTQQRQSSSSLNMIPTGIAASAIAGTITGGLFSGGLHAIAGPDHLAALLPKCCGQRWFRAGRIGALWGMGHGISACLLGMLAFGLKSKIGNLRGAQTLLNGASHVMEIAVGLSLVVIGLLGIKEAKEWKDELSDVQPKSLSAAAADPGIAKTQKRAVIFNGLLHGFSWDGAPSLAPALAVATWRGNIAFLLSYAIGTMMAMCFTTTLIGEGTRRAGEVFHRPDIPQKLSMYSSIFAILIGIVWCGLALK